MRTMQERARWIDEVEEVFEECKRSISDAVKEYEESVGKAIDDLKVDLKTQG
jgi:hypothetical protein